MPALPLRSSFALLPVALLMACGHAPTPQQHIAQQFDSVNTGLDTIAHRVDFTQQNTQLRTTLAQRSCTAWKLRGDSLHEALVRATERLERMKAAMDHGSMDDRQIADSVFQANGDGEQLYKELRRFYTVALHSAADTAALRRAENMSMQVLSFPTAQDWRQQCFAQVPRISSSTILSKISTDMLLLENLCLHSILKECERSVGGSPFPEKEGA